MTGAYPIYFPHSCSATAMIEKEDPDNEEHPKASDIYRALRKRQCPPHGSALRTILNIALSMAQHYNLNVVDTLQCHE
jgi:hypothetical protein